MAVKYFCDRCKKETKSLNVLTTTKVSKTIDLYPNCMGLQLEICNECKDMLRKWVLES